MERNTAPLVVHGGDGIIIQRELKGERGVIVARQQFPGRLFADGQAAGGETAVCGLEGQGAGEFSTGLDQIGMPGIFILRVGVPAGAAAVVVPAGNEIIAVRGAIQLPASAGGAKGEGTTSIIVIVDVVTKTFCVVVVQLHVIRKDRGAHVRKTAAKCGVVVPNRAGTQIQGGTREVVNAAVLVSFYFEIDTLFDGKGILRHVDNTELGVVIHQDGCTFLDHKLAAIQPSLREILNTMFAISTCGNIRTALNRELSIKTVVDADIFVAINGYTSATCDLQDPAVLDARQTFVVAQRNRCATFNGHVTSVRSCHMSFLILVVSCVHIQTAAAATMKGVEIAIVLAGNTSANEAFLQVFGAFGAYGAADAKAGTAVEISFQSGSAIHVQRTNVDAKLPSGFVVVRCLEHRSVHGQLTVIEAEAIVAVIGHLNFRRIQRHVNGVQHQARMAAAGGFQTRVFENDLTIGPGVL